MVLDDSPRERTWMLLFAAWLVALVATLAALFIGEILGQAPCPLCWYQRTFMFPLAIILGIACYRSDRAIWRYALPLAVLGCLMAAFHTAQYMEWLPESIEPCDESQPCTGPAMELAGLPIPMLSLAAFGALIVLLLLTRRRLA